MKTKMRKRGLGSRFMSAFLAAVMVVSLLPALTPMAAAYTNADGMIIDARYSYYTGEADGLRFSLNSDKIHDFGKTKGITDANGWCDYFLVLAYTYSAKQLMKSRCASVGGTISNSWFFNYTDTGVPGLVWGSNSTIIEEKLFTTAGYKDPLTGFSLIYNMVDSGVDCYVFATKEGNLPGWSNNGSGEWHDGLGTSYCGEIIRISLHDWVADLKTAQAGRASDYNADGTVQRYFPSGKPMGINIENVTVQAYKTVNELGYGELHPLVGVWRRDGVPICTVDGVKDDSRLTYYITDADAGHVLDCVITAKNSEPPGRFPSAGLSGTVTSNSVLVEAGLSAVSISGNTEWGNTLTAVPVAVGATNHVKYQWYRNGTAISGATGKTYTTSFSDWNQSISVNATSGQTVTAYVYPSSKSISGTAVISGNTNGIGNVLSVSGLDASKIASYSWSRYKNGVSTTVGTKSTYTTTTEDAGSQLYVNVWAADGYSFGGYSNQITSNVQVGYKLVGTPSVSGSTSTWGNTLSVTGLATAGVTGYQWLRDGAVISGATSSTYNTTAADGGHAISIRIGVASGYTGSTSGGVYASTATSAAVSIGKKTMPTPTVSGWSGNYDMAAHGIKVTPNLAGATVSYGTSSGTYNYSSSPTRTAVGTTTVYYKVSAQGYTDYTGSANVTINKTNPTAPTITGIAHTGVSRQVRVSFAAPTNHGGAAVSQYRLYYNTTNTIGNSYVTLSGTSSPQTAVIPGIVDDTNYYYWLMAYNGNYWSPASAAVNAKTYGTPTAPLGVTVTQTPVGLPNGTQAIVSWNAPQNLYAGSVTYTVSYTGTTSGTVAVNQASRTATVTGLTKGGSYTFTVKATNPGGYYSTATASVTMPKAPAAPKVTGYEITGDGTTVVVTFTVPGENLSPILAGKAGYRVSGGTLSSLALVSGASTSTPGAVVKATITGLAKGTSYNLGLAAVNSAGQSANGYTGTFKTWYAPSGPTDVKVQYTGTGNGSTVNAAVTWGIPADIGGNSSLTYLLEMSENGGAFETVMNWSANRSFSITGLSKDTAYQLRVTPKNPAGIGTKITTNKVPAWDTADAVRTLTATEGNNYDRLDLRWGYPTDDGYQWNNGANTPADYRPNTKEVLNYRVFVNSASTTAAGKTVSVGGQNIIVGQGNSYATISAAASTRNGASAAVTGMVKGADYVFSIVPINDVGSGTARTVSFTTWKEPDAPVITSAKSKAELMLAAGSAVVPTYDNMVTLVWTTPNHNGNALLDYVIHVYNATGEELGSLVVNTKADGKLVTTRDVSTLQTVTAVGQAQLLNGNKLRNDTAYQFSVVARNSVNTSAVGPSTGVDNYSAKATAKSYYKPYAPETVTGQAHSDSRTDLSWAASVSNGKPVTAYNIVIPGVTDVAGVTARTNGNVVTYSNGISVTYPGGISATTAIVRGLKEHTNYTFQIWAVNSLGTADTSKNILLTTLQKPNAPTTVTAAPTDRTHELRVTATAPATDSVTPAHIGYNIYVKVDGTYYLAGYHNVLRPNEYDTERAVSDEGNFATLIPQTGKLDFTINGYQKDNTFFYLQDGVRYDLSVAGVSMLGKDNSVHNDSADTERREGYRTNTASTPRRPADAPEIDATVEADRYYANRADATQRVSFHWQVPESNGGSAITGYHIIPHAVSAGAGDEAFAELTIAGQTVKVSGDDYATVSADTRRVDVAGLRKGETYSFEVRAYTAAGNGDRSSSDKLVLWYNANAPKITGANTVGATGDARVSWNAPTDNGGDDMLGYRIYYKVEGAADSTKVLYNTEYFKKSSSTEQNYVFEVPVYKETWQVSGLELGVSYVFAVSGVNGAGEGDLSAWSDPVLARTTADAPIMGAVKTGNTTATVTKIEAPAKKGGTAVTGYAIYVDDVTEKNVDDAFADFADNRGKYLHTSTGVPNNATANDVLLEGLENGHTYAVAATAINGAGQGVLSGTALVTVGMPLPPENISGRTIAATTGEVAFGAAEGNGSDIVAYHVYREQGGTLIEVATVPAEPGKTEYSAQVEGELAGETLHLSITSESGLKVMGGYALGDSGTESTQSEQVAITLGAPSAPSISMARTYTDPDRVSFRWTAAKSNGFLVSEYRLYVDGYPVATVRPTDDSKAELTFEMTKEELHTLLLAFDEKYTDDYGPKTGYVAQVSAVNEKGEGGKSDEVRFVFGAPGTPSITGITSSNSTLTIDVEPMGGDRTNLLGFRAYVQPDDGTTAAPSVEKTPDTEVNDPNAGAITVANLSNGVKYKVVVSAYNAMGESIASAYRLATPYDVPSEPRKPSASVTGKDSVVVTWSAPADDRGSEITGYTVECVSTEPNDAAVEINGTQAVVTNLAPNTTYHFVVRAVNAKGAGDRAVTGEVVTNGKPGAPEISYCTATRDGFALEWEAPDYTGGEAITGYRLYMNSRIISRGADETSYVAVGRELEQTYVLQVAAVNSVGEGEKSEAVTITVGAPVAPVITGVAVGDGSLTVGWQSAVPVAGNISGYYIYFDDASGDPAFNKVGRVDAETLTYTGSGLENGRTYRITVEATDVNDLYARSIPWTATPGTAPAPTFTATPGKNSISVELGEPTWVGDAITGYLIYVDGSEAARATLTRDEVSGAILSATYTPNDGVTKAATVGQSGVSFTLDGYTGGKNYAVAAASINAFGDGLRCAKQTVAVWDAPSVPAYENMTMTFDKNTNLYGISANFIRPDSRGTSLSVWRVALTGDPMHSGGESVEIPVGDGAAHTMNDKAVAVSEYTDAETGLAMVRVELTGCRRAISLNLNLSAQGTAENGDKLWGMGDSCAFITGMPNRAVIREVRVIGEDTVEVSYGVEDYDGNLSKYSVYLNYADGNTTPAVTQEGTTATISGLTPGQTYSVTVAAWSSSVGYGEQSEPVEVIAGTPMAPTILKTTSGAGQVSLSWSAPVKTYGSTVTGYRVYYGTDTTHTEWVPVRVTNTSATITGLTDGKTYTFQVSAMSNRGEGALSEPKTATPSDVPGAPQDVTASVKSDSAITISWKTPASNGGKPVTGYCIREERDRIEPIEVSGSTLETTVTGLSRGTAYAFTVEAKNDNGWGAASEAVSAKTHSAPGAPEVYFVELGTRTLSPVWFLPEDNGGEEILGFNVYYKKENSKVISQVTDPDGMATVSTPNGEIEYISLEKCEINPDPMFPEKRRFSFAINEGLAVGAKYYVLVTAVNAVDEGETSTPYLQQVVSQVEQTAPSAPYTMSLTPGDGILKVDWTESRFDGNGDIEGYFVYVEQCASDGSTTLAQKNAAPIPPAPSMSYTISGLVNGQEYKVVVKAKNTIGLSEGKEAYGRPLADPVAPDAPTGLRYVTYMDGGVEYVTIYWTAPANNGGDSDISYTVYSSTSGVERVLAENVKETGFTMQMENSAYTICVAAGNHYGGPIHCEKNLIVGSGLNQDTNRDGQADEDGKLDQDGNGMWDVLENMTAPGAPIGLYASGDGTAEITIYWERPYDLGGELEDNLRYNVFVNGELIQSGIKDTSYVLPAETGKTYTVQVCAQNAKYTGPNSKMLTLKGPSGSAALAVPTDLVAVVSGTKVQLSWVGAAGEGVTGYQLYYQCSDGTTDTQTVTGAEATSYTFDPGVAELDRFYLFHVTAVYGDKESGASNTALCTVSANGGTTEPVVPGVPGDVDVSVGDASETDGVVTGSLNIGWNLVDEATSYNVYINGDKTTLAVDDPNLTIAVGRASYTSAPVALSENGVPCDFVIWITAENENGTSALAAGSAATVSGAVPGGETPNSPEQFVLTALTDGTGFTATWDAPAESGGMDLVYDVTLYLLQSDGTVLHIEKKDIAGTSSDFTHDDLIAAGVSDPAGLTAIGAVRPVNIIVASSTVTGYRVTYSAVENPVEGAVYELVADEINTVHTLTAEELAVGQIELSTLAEHTALVIRETIPGNAEEAAEDQVATYPAQAETLTATSGETRHIGVLSGVDVAISASTVPTDPTLPVPSNLTARVERIGGKVTIDLSWTVDTIGDAVKYRVYNFVTPMDETTGTQTQRTLEVTDGKYYLVVAAVAANGKVGEFSQVKYVDTLEGTAVPDPDAPAPGAPVIVKSVSDGLSRIRLFWAAPTVNPELVDHYNLYLDGELTGTAGGDATDFIVDLTGVSARKQLPFTLRAVGSDGQISDISNAWTTRLTYNVAADPEGPLDDFDSSGTVDTDGDGVADARVKIIRGTVESGSGGTAKLTLFKNGSALVSSEVEVGKEFALSVVMEEQAQQAQVFSRIGETEGSETYTLVAEKENSTSYIIKSLTLDADETQLQAQIVLYEGDLNGDGVVNANDLAIILRYYGTADLRGDINRDGIVNANDLAIVNRNMGRATLEMDWSTKN